MMDNLVDAPLERTYWVFPGQFLAGAYAGKPNRVDHFRRLSTLIDVGIRTFVNLMEEDELDKAGNRFMPYENELKSLVAGNSERIDCHRFPVKEVSVPTIGLMNQILDVIDDSISIKRPVYVHCFGGTGRTGTVVSCWLLRHGHADIENVFQLLQFLRTADTKRAAMRSPDTDEQCGFVRTWFATMN